MQVTLSALALLASSSLVAAKPASPELSRRQFPGGPGGPGGPDPDDCVTSTCTAIYSTQQNIISDPVTYTSTNTYWNTSYITTSTPSPVVRTDLITTTSTSTTSWEVTTNVTMPYTTYRVITIPIHTFSLVESCATSSSELYPTSVLTSYCTETTMVEDILTTSTPCYDPYPVTSWAVSTQVLVATSTSCSTFRVDPITAPPMPTATGGWS